MGRPKKLTREQVLEAINRWLLSHGVPPSLEELRKALRLGSKRTVLRYLQWLEEVGDIQRFPGARGLKPLRAGGVSMETRPVPVVGQVPAGPLMLAEENREGWVRLPQKMVPKGSQFFLLRVRGDSMNRARVGGKTIEDGDLVLVRQQQVAEHGAVVVAILDGEATVKRLTRGPDYYVLKPDSAERKHRPIVVDREFRIQGVITGVLKKGSEIIT